MDGHRLTSRRRNVRFLALSTVAILVISLCWLGLRAKGPEPPKVDLDGASAEVAGAIESALLAVRRDSRSATNWGRLGMLLLANQFDLNARQCLAEAERLEPSNPRWPYFASWTYAAEPSASMLPLLERAVLGFADVPAPRLRLAEALVELGRFDEAKSCFLEVLKRDPENPHASVGLARAELLEDHPQAALDLALRAVDSPWTRKARQAVVLECYRRISDRDAIAQAARRFAELPDDPAAPDPIRDELNDLKLGVDAQLQTVESLFRHAGSAVALKRLERIARDYPASYRAQLQFGKALVLNGNFPVAIEVVDRAVRQAPDVAELHLVLGDARFHKGDFSQAAASFQRAIDLAPNDAIAYFNLAQCLVRLDDRDHAADAFAAALRQKPNLPKAHAGLAALLEQQGQTEAALAHARIELEIAPNDDEAKAIVDRLAPHESR
jgi:tetratricopeptide (TPR) repeat protein